MNINELEELAKVATPGEWKAIPGSNMESICVETLAELPPQDHAYGQQTVIGSSEWTFCRNEDSAYIAAANPVAILELIAAYREAVAALIRIERGTDGVTQPYKWFSSLDIKEIAKEPIDTAKRLGADDDRPTNSSGHVPRP